MWLDYSEAHQRGIRDALRAFEEKGTVDDLGFGVIRDAISNALFPGTSIIQTRARYFLFVPWIFMEAQRRSPRQLVAKASDMERLLIRAIKNSGNTDGLIGIQADTMIKTLPSAIYWAGLQTYGIFKLKGRTIRQFGRLAGQEGVRTEFEGEIADIESSYWGDVPPAPPGFFKFDEAQLSLTKEEASWLSERMISTSRNLDESNLLTQLVLKIRDGDASLIEHDYVWSLQNAMSISDRNREVLFHAERFSLLAYGLSLLYNQMLCELRRSKQAEFRPDLDYLEQLTTWADDASRCGLVQWCQDLDPFFSCLLGFESRISHPTKEFVRQSAQLVAKSGVSDLAHSAELRNAIVERERIHKRDQARFGNAARLAAYAGQAGGERMPFRWGIAKRLLTDIAVGLGSSVL
jgi:hypothetical protein